MLLPIAFTAARAFACGPEFPNWMLDRAEEAVLAAPIADFDRELERLKLPAPKFSAMLTTNNYLTQAAEADVADLRSALRKTDLSKTKQGEMLEAYKQERLKVTSDRKALDKDDDDTPVVALTVESDPARRSTMQSLDEAGLEGIPAEFTDYLRGSFGWHQGRTNEARAEWEKILERPAEKRHYRSTWAAYMLGRYWHETDPEKAQEYYRQVREFASSGFADRLGLAVASLGWEAQIHLKRNEFGPAIRLYLEQLAGGDDGVASSLRVTANCALLKGGAQLRELAADPNARRVITALILARRDLGSLQHDADESTRTDHMLMVRWLAAVEAAHVKDVESAEQLALAAYRLGQWRIAQRWIERASTTPVTQWLQAKLLLRAGKVPEAAALLDGLVRAFPLDLEETNQPAPENLKDNLYMSGFSYVSQNISAGAEVLAESGVLHLVRREFTEALDALLRSGFWMDAAYVAERVLTLDELKSYVDGHWPAVAKAQSTQTNQDDKSPGAPITPRMDVRQEIRYLLARRLTRMERAAEARAYYPSELQDDFDQLTQYLGLGWDETAAAGQRAKGFTEAAKLVRNNGMELLGTEVEPDWHIHGGSFEEGVTVESRSSTNHFASFLAASRDEVRRAEHHTADPETRFHYRYQAAFLGWEGAKLMPNNTDDLARLLCTAGSWLKARDPETADIFYKTLVRRCRQTAIGKLADRMRWFPDLDAYGNPVPWSPDPPEEVQPAAQENGVAQEGSGVQGSGVAGYWYALNRGNTLEDVLGAAAKDHGVVLNVEELADANPAVNRNKLKAGQIVFVPAPKGEAAPDNAEPTMEAVPETPQDETVPEEANAAPQR